MNLSVQAMAVGATVQIKGPDETVVLLPYLEVLIAPDNGQPQTLQEVSQRLDFKPVSNASSPAVNTNVWYRFRLGNEAADDTRWVLDFAETLFDDIEFYYQHNGEWMSYRQGLIHKLSAKPVKSLFVAFPLRVDAGQNSTFYFRFNSSHQPLVYPILYPASEYASVISFHSGLSLIFIGVLLGITVVVTATIISVKEHKGLLTFAGLIISILLVIAYINGLLHTLMPDSPEFHRALYPYINLATNVAMLLFVRELFQLRKRRPALDRLLLVYISAAVIFPLIHYLYGIHHLPVATNTISLVTTLILILIGVDAYRQKQPSAFFYLVALLFFLIPTLYTVLGARGLIPYTVWARHSYELGALFLGVFISLSIRDTLRQTLKIKDESQSRELVVDIRDKMKSEFLAAMSHEIRTPINGVLGMAQLLQMTNQSQTQSYYTDIIINSGKTLLTVINDILDLSKVEAGKMVLEKESVDLGKLIVYVSNTFATDLDHTQVQYSYDMGVDVPVFVIADPVRLEQVITNLLSNAAKFTEHGEITFTIRKLENLAANKVKLRFSIADTGVGIPPEMQDSIFDPYTQDRASAIKPSPFKSTGLGLSICKRLVELMDGSISLSSEPGAGSRFWFDVTLAVDTIKQRRYQALIDQFAGYQLGFLDIPDPYAQTFALHLDHWGMQVIQFQSLDELSSMNPRIDVLLVFMSTTIAYRNDVLDVLKHAPYKSLILLAAGHEEPELDESADNKILFLRVPAGLSLYVDAFSRLLLESPCDNEFHQVLPADPAKASIPLPLQVLVVEDNPTNQKVIRAMLKELSCSVLLAENGAEGFELYQQHYQDLDLIIMDCEMPVMDGFECTRAIRYFETEKELDRLAIIALTAHALPANSERCLAAGMDSVMTKPIKINQLERALQGIIARGQSRGALE